MNAIRHNNIRMAQLRPTQMTVGMLEVKQKRQRLRLLEKRPAELVDFILEHPIRAVFGPKGHVYVVDHHHLALALMKEDFESAPMDVECDLSSMTMQAFWKKMQELEFVHPYDSKGVRKTTAYIPGSLKDLKDDPYRSLAGFVREAGGYRKVPAPFAEFQWADYYRGRVRKKMIEKHFHKTLQHAIALAHEPDARSLPGYLAP